MYHLLNSKQEKCISLRTGDVHLLEEAKGKKNKADHGVK